MVTIITKKNCRSSRRVLHWFIAHEVPYKEIPASKLTPTLIKEALIKTVNGLTDILSTRAKYPLPDLNIPAMINYLSSHPEHLRSPIIIGSRITLCGYNEEEITIFTRR